MYALPVFTFRVYAPLSCCRIRIADARTRTRYWPSTGLIGAPFFVAAPVSTGAPRRPVHVKQAAWRADERRPLAGSDRRLLAALLSPAGIYPGPVRPLALSHSAFAPDTCALSLRTSQLRTSRPPRHMPRHLRTKSVWDNAQEASAREAHEAVCMYNAPSHEFDGRKLILIDHEFTPCVVVRNTVPPLSIQTRTTGPSAVLTLPRAPSCFPTRRLSFAHCATRNRSPVLITSQVEDSAARQAGHVCPAFTRSCQCMIKLQHHARSTAPKHSRRFRHWEHLRIGYKLLAGVPASARTHAPAHCCIFPLRNAASRQRVFAYLARTLRLGRAASCSVLLEGGVLPLVNVWGCVDADVSPLQG